KRRYRILFRPSETMLRRGNEPILLFRELKRLGTLAIDVDMSGLPPLESLDPTTSYLGWSLELVTNAGRADLEEIFEFVEGDCDLEVFDAGEEAVPPRRRPPALAAPSDAALKGSAKPSREPDKGREATAYTSIRVDLERIDRMVDMVGEIVIAQAAILQQV